MENNIENSLNYLKAKYKARFPNINFLSLEDFAKDLVGYAEYLGAQVSNLIPFGTWVLIDGKTSGQVVGYFGGAYKIDINGSWDDFEEVRVTVDERYSVPKTITIEISRCLHQSGYKPYSASSRLASIKGENKNFNTLADLKDYYKIKKMTKMKEKGWAISGTGRKHEWLQYTAEISFADYFIKGFVSNNI